jgi:small subunit ribosomal protein S1
VDVGGVDALLHVADISWGRVNKPADALAVGQEIEAKVLKVDAAKRRIAIGMKQLLPHPWDLASEKYKTGERVTGAVTRVTDFGAFVELEKGIEGLIHLSEMSWSKKARKPSDVLKPGEQVEVMVLGVNQADRRIALGLKQALGDPWVEAPQKFPVGAVVEAPVTSLTKFGAFVQLAEGIEGMIHIGDISAEPAKGKGAPGAAAPRQRSTERTDVPNMERRINHPQDVLKVGQVVRAQVLEVDTGKRRLRLGMKQLIPTSVDEYIAEHKEGDVVTGRMTEVGSGRVRVELGEGIHAACRLSAEPVEKEEKRADPKTDLSSLTSMLEAKWKGGQATGTPRREPVRAGQIRSFRIAKLDAAAKRIELELA